MATIAAIVLILVGVFMYQIGSMHAGGAQSSAGGQQASASGAGAGAASGTGAMKRLGILQYVSHPALDEIHRGIIDALKQRGFVEGKNIEIFDQNGQADQSKLSTMSQQLVDKHADALVGIATPAVQALANTTTDIPIVMGAVTDPVSAGLVKDMRHPGGNITGVSDQPPVARQIELGLKLMPHATTVGMLYSSSEDNSKSQIDQAAKQAEKQGLSVKKFAVPSSNEIAQSVQVMSRQVDFIYIPLDNTIASAMPTVVQEADKAGKPIITAVDTMVEQGGLATIGVNQYQLGIKTGQMAADTLQGKTKPADTPVYTFSKGDTILNRRKAAALGITVPDDVLRGATIVGDDKQ